MQNSIRAHLLPGVEEDTLAVDHSYRDVVIRLRCRHQCRIEYRAIPVYDLHWKHVQSGGTSESDIEKRDLIGRTALLLPDVLSTFDFSKLLALELRLGLFTREVRVLYLHYLGIDLARFLIIRVSRCTDLGDGILERLRRFCKMVCLFLPSIAFFLPEFAARGVLRVVELQPPVDAVLWRHPILRWRGR